MKTLRYTLLLGFCAIIFGFQVQAKEKARISVEYQKVMGQDASLFMNVKFKGEDGYEPATNLNLFIYEEVEEDSLYLSG